MQSNDARKNFTDFQETAQWLGGLSVPLKLLEALNVGGTGREPAVVPHDMCLNLMPCKAARKPSSSKHPV